MRRINQALGAVLLAAAMAPANAQPVWRCGSSYGHTPCADGGTAVRSDDARTDEQARQTAAAARRDALAARQMEAARLAQERHAPRAVVLGDSPDSDGARAESGGTKSRPAGPGKGGKPKGRQAAEGPAADVPFTAVAPAPPAPGGPKGTSTRKPSG